MDDEQDGPVTPPLADASPPYPQCPDCGEEFRPGHLCRQRMLHEIECTRAAFQIAVTSLGKIRNALILWRRGQETAKLRQVSAMAREALGQIEELLKAGKAVPDE